MSCLNLSVAGRMQTLKASHTSRLFWLFLGYYHFFPLSYRMFLSKILSFCFQTYLNCHHYQRQMSGRGMIWRKEGEEQEASLAGRQGPALQIRTVLRTPLSCCQCLWLQAHLSLCYSACASCDLSVVLQFVRTTESTCSSAACILSLVLGPSFVLFFCRLTINPPRVSMVITKINFQVQLRL